MQSCPKNADTGPLIGNGKGAPVVSGPGLSLPPSALVGPPSPARGLAGLAPPHGANAWDTDRVQLNPARRKHNQGNQQPLPSTRNHVGVDSRPQNSDCIAKVRNESRLFFYYLCSSFINVPTGVDWASNRWTALKRFTRLCQISWRSGQMFVRVNLEGIFFFNRKLGSLKCRRL